MAVPSRHSLISWCIRFFFIAHLDYFLVQIQALFYSTRFLNQNLGLIFESLVEKFFNVFYV